MNIKLIIYLFIAGLILISCKKDTDKVDLHEGYFPLQQGQFVEYDVRSIFHDDAADRHETTNYILKTVVGDTIIDNSGRIARQFYRYVFSDVLQEFVVQDLWTAILDQGRAELVEENQRIIKLVFAPTLEKTWDFNAFNSKDPILAFYENIHKPLTVNGNSFDSTLTVVEEKMSPNLVEYRRKLEVYAKNVGMIYKIYKNISIANFDTLNPLTGTELMFTVKSYGIE